MDSIYDRVIGGGYGKKNADYCPVSDVYTENDVNHYVRNCNLGNGGYG